MSGANCTIPFPDDHKERLARAHLSLDGLSVGDAFGQRFFYPPSVESLIAGRAVPAPPWPYTDDTEMALAIIEVLSRGAFRPLVRGPPHRPFQGGAVGDGLRAG